MQTHFAVAHDRFLSIFDINSQQWEHVTFGDRVFSGFRFLDSNNSSNYLALIVLNSGKIHFVSAQTAKIMDRAGQYTDLKGQVITVAQEKNHQRFVLFIIKRS